MNLVEKLIRIDREKFTRRELKKVKSKRLSKVMGEETEVTIQELSGKRLNDLTQMLMDRKGNKDLSKLQDANLMYCVNGIVEPNLKDQKLLDHFGVKTPKELAELIFDSEAGKIANEIARLSGIGEDSEDEVKNS